jgi:hypothetical protein
MMDCNIKETAQIVGHQRVNPLTGDTWVEYEWVGSPSGIASVNWIHLDPRYRTLPWPLEVLGEDWTRCKIFVCRKDVAIGYIANRAIAAADRMRVRSLWVWSRLILTLQVWGLAYVPPGSMPSRQHIGKKRL